MDLVSQMRGGLEDYIGPATLGISGDRFPEFLRLSGRRPLQSSRSRRVIDPKRIFVPNGAPSVELCPFPFKNLDFRPESELRGRNLSCGC